MNVLFLDSTNYYFFAFSTIFRIFSEVTSNNYLLNLRDQGIGENSSEFQFAQIMNLPNLTRIAYNKIILHTF